MRQVVYYRREHAFGLVAGCDWIEYLQLLQSNSKSFFPAIVALPVQKLPVIDKGEQCIGIWKF